MESTIDLTPFTQFAGTLGAFVIIIWLFFDDRKNHKKTIEEKDKALEQKNDQLLKAFEKNATINSELQSTIKENSRVTRTLADRVTTLLIKNGND